MTAGTNDRDARSRSYNAAATIEELRGEIAALSTLVEDQKNAQLELAKVVTKLNDSWNQATGTLRFIKWITGAIAAAGTIMVTIKTFFPHAHG